MVSHVLTDTSRWQTLGKLASSALLAEARLTPKPALVDERGSGINPDLTLETTLKSAFVLEPFFQKMAQHATDKKPSQRLRETLTGCGRQAEFAMMKATKGSSSHRGAIWCLGLLVAAAAMHQADATVSEIVKTAAQLAAFNDRNTPEKETHGLIVQRAYGVGGARAEAQAGFPHVTTIGLPHLQNCRQAGVSESSCRLDTLLAIMSVLDDTCLLYRGGLVALSMAKKGAQEVLALGGTSTPAGMNRLFQLDRDLRIGNVSPSGSANLLAATLFLDSLNSPILIRHLGHNGDI